MQSKQNQKPQQIGKIPETINQNSHENLVFFSHI